MRLPLIRFSAASLLVITSVALASCKQKPIDLPTGPQHITGILQPVPLSPTRRGTHVLEVDGKPFVFVESSAVPLDQYEGISVTVDGTLQQNIDPSLLPVLEATAVEPPVTVLKQWTIASLGLTFSAPYAWRSQTDAQGMTFTSTGSVDPLLQVRKVDLVTLPSGDTMAIGGEKAVKVPDGSGQILYVEHGTVIMAIAFFPQGDDAQKSEMNYLFRQVLKSVSFSSSSMSVSSQATGSGIVVGQPCGGPAGILCPTGSYCEVTDNQTNVGRCKTLH